MDNRKIINKKITYSNEIIDVDYMLLYWWEEQEIKYNSLVYDKNTSNYVFNNAKYEKDIVNKSIVRINDRTVDNLNGKRWSDVLVFNLIPILYKNYEEISSIPREEFLRFREEVKKFFLGEIDDNYIIPPEVLEYVILKEVGGINIAEIRQMSYKEFIKLYTIINLDKACNRKA